ncbi:hypothetical protein [Marinilactibacillus psychrotolerans]|nr:hypothetical protein [Marinilactibacillus psychrotolerans]
MKLPNEYYALEKKLENEYGSMKNVPEDNFDLIRMNHLAGKEKQAVKKKRKTTEKGEDNMSNGLMKLNGYLFSQLDKLNDEDLIGENLKEEITRSKATTEVAKQIINNGRLVLDAHKYKTGNNGGELPTMLESGEDE